MGYYYLIPQLSYLVYGQTPPLSSEEFKEKFIPLLPEKDAALLTMLGLDPQPPGEGEHSGLSYAEKAPSCGADFIDRWNEWERSLRLNLAKHRSRALKRDAVLADAPSLPSDIAAVIIKAMQESPLEGEDTLNRARWSAIDGLLEGRSYFDRNTVFAYMLKLMILERKNTFQTETGFSEYKSLYASILEQSGTLSAGECK